MLDSLPSDWRVMRFSEVITEIYGGGTPDKTNADYWDGGIYWASVKDLVSFNPTSTQDRISAEGLKNSSAKIVKSGTLIFCTRMAVGVARVYDVDVAINQDLKAIVPNSLCSRDFLFYWFENQKKSIEGLATGTTVKGVRQSMLLNMEIILPPLAEQQRISEILTSVDDSIRATEAVIAQAERVKRGLMEDLLTGGLGSAAIARGEVPEGWKSCNLADLSLLQRGKFSARPRNDPKFYGGEIPFLQTGDVSNSLKYVSSYSQTLNGEGLKVSKLFSAGKILMSIAANVGDVAILTFDAAMPDSVVAISPFDGVNRDFLFHLLGAKKKELEAIATQNAQANLNLDKLNKFGVVVPQEDRQAKIAAALNSIDDQIASNQATAVQQLQVKRGLMDDLLTGRVRTV